MGFSGFWLVVRNHLVKGKTRWKNSWLLIFWIGGIELASSSGFASWGAFLKWGFLVFLCFPLFWFAGFRWQEVGMFKIQFLFDYLSIQVAGPWVLWFFYHIWAIMFWNSSRYACYWIGDLDSWHKRIGIYCYYRVSVILFRVFVVGMMWPVDFICPLIGLCSGSLSWYWYLWIFTVS